MVTDLHTAAASLIVHLHVSLWQRYVLVQQTAPGPGVFL